MELGFITYKTLDQSYAGNVPIKTDLWFGKLFTVSE